MRSSIPQDDDPPIDRPHRTGPSAKNIQCGCHQCLSSLSSLSQLLVPYHHSEFVSFHSIYTIYAPLNLNHPRPILARTPCAPNSEQRAHWLILHTMGGSLSRIWSLLWSTKEIRILILGLVRCASSASHAGNAGSH